MTDPLDEYVVQQRADFEGAKLTSVTRSNAGFGEEKTKQERLEEEFKDLTSWLKGVYGDKVEKVTVSNKLVKSPAVVSTGQYGWSANMERIMRAQTFSDNAQAQYMMSKKTLEVNPRHPIVAELNKKISVDKTDADLINLAKLILDSALLVSGFQLDDAAEVSRRLLRSVAVSLSVDPNAEPEDEPEEDEVVEETSSDDADSNPEDVMETLLEEDDAPSHSHGHHGHDEL